MNRTVRDALAAAARRLVAASDTPRLDAELLMAKALGCEREALLLSDQQGEMPVMFEELVGRRERGEPVAYITGRRAFWTIELAVGPGVLVPRPETETLIEAAVDHFGPHGPKTILDLGTGSGALLLAALDQWPNALGVGIDTSTRALEIARCNAVRLGLGERVEFRRGDWGDGLDATFDLVLCNPPYVEEGAQLPRDVQEWEPPEALFAGPDGLDQYKRFVPQIGSLSAPGGIICLEVGAGQATAVGALFETSGARVMSRRDLAGHVRCLIVQY